MAHPRGDEDDRPWTGRLRRRLSRRSRRIQRDEENVIDAVATLPDQSDPQNETTTAVAPPTATVSNPQHATASPIRFQQQEAEEDDNNRRNPIPQYEDEPENAFMEQLAVDQVKEFFPTVSDSQIRSLLRQGMSLQEILKFFVTQDRDVHRELLEYAQREAQERAMRPGAAWVQNRTPPSHFPGEQDSTAARSQRQDDTTTSHSQNDDSNVVTERRQRAQEEEQQEVPQDGKKKPAKSHCDDKGHSITEHSYQDENPLHREAVRSLVSLDDGQRQKKQVTFRMEGGDKEHEPDEDDDGNDYENINDFEPSSNVAEADVEMVMQVFPKADRDKCRYLLMDHSLEQVLVYFAEESTSSA